MVKLKLVLIFLLLLGLSVTIFKLVLYLNGSFFVKLQKTNMIFVSDNSISVLSFTGKESTLINFPIDKKVIVPRGYGEYELGKVYRLGELDKKGGILLTETLESSLHIPAAGYIFIENFTNQQDVSLALIKQYLRVSVTGKVNSNLKLNDLLIMLVKTFRLSPILFRVTDFEKGEMAEIFKDRAVREEALGIEILNATEHDGLAQQATLFWENLGGRVIRVSDSKEQINGKCKIIYSPDVKNSYTLSMLNFFFNCEQEESAPGNNRVDLSLVLGEGYWKIQSEKW